MKIPVQTLNRINFSDYGEVISNEGKPLSSTSAVHDYWDRVAEFNTDGKFVCSLLSIKKRAKEPVCEMERHLKTPEVLIALHSDSMITVAAADENASFADESTIKSFLLVQGKGVVLKKGVWHALPCTNAKDSLLLVIFKENTSYADDPKTETDIHFCSLKDTVNLEF